MLEIISNSKVITQNRNLSKTWIWGGRSLLAQDSIKVGGVWKKNWTKNLKIQ